MSFRRRLTLRIAAVACIGLPFVSGDTRLEAQDRGMRQSFDASSPALGEPLPDLRAYDAEGNAIELRSALEGHYSVIVFGCLT